MTTKIPPNFTTLKSTLRLLEKSFSKAQKIKIILVVLAQIVLAVLDLMGVLLIGGLGAIAVSQIDGQALPSSIERVLLLLPTSPSSVKAQLFSLGVIASFFFILRTIVGLQLSKRILFFLSNQSAVTSKSLIDKIFTSGLLQIQAASKQNYMFVITSGMNTLYIGILSSLVFILSDAILLFTLFFMLLVVNPIITLLTFFLFAFIGVILWKYLDKRGKVLGKENTSIHIKSLDKISEVLDHYRENVIRNTLEHQSENLTELRMKHSRALAEINYLPNITKYLFELSLVIFLFIISILAFVGQSTSSAISTISVFFIAATRIAPAILRIQNSTINIGTSIGAAQSTLTLLEELNFEIKTLPPKFESLDFRPSFDGTVELKEVFFKYPYSDSSVFSGVNLKIDQGAFVGIVGPSGGGKSTLVDLILGLISPTSGSIEVSGVDSISAVGLFPGKFGYLPQRVGLFNGTVKENICMGFPEGHFSDKEVLDALELAQAEDFVSRLPNGINTTIGEYGIMLSGGQLQRIGIARALVTQPKLVIFDEPTSSLDSKTEIEVSQAICSLKGSRTIIVVAHKLSTISQADKVIVVNSRGNILEGKFAEISGLDSEFFGTNSNF